MPRIPPRVVWPLAGVAVAVLVVGGVLLGIQLGNLHNGLLAVAFAAVGLYVVRQRPGNREGMLFVATGVAQAAMFAARQYGLHTPALPGSAWIGWLGVWPLPLVFVLTAVTLMSFPTGRLPSPAWRSVVVALAVLGVALAVTSALWPVEYARVPLAAPHPLDVPGAEIAAAVHPWAAAIGYPAFQAAWVVCAVVRLARARGDEARQLRWFVFAVAATGVVMAVGLIGWGTPEPGLLAVPLVPLAAGAAILKYRLYDIDPVIATTLVWGAMAAVVTLGYAVVVVGVGSLVGGSGTLLALLATALVAVAFEPLRRRAQRVADRIVYGHRATPYEALSRLSAQLTGPSSGLLDGLCATVADGTGARQVVLWTGPSGELRAVSAWPAGTSCPDEVRAFDELTSGGHAVPVAHGSRTLGALVVTRTRGPLTTGEHRLLTDLAAQAGLVLELRASAQRLVAAGDEARRRLERDLHDGAQQRLVTVALELGGLAQAAEGVAAPLAARAETARRQLLQATAELRETARGLHPAVLTQDGLEAALAFLADRSAVPVRLAVSVDRRLAPAVEATAYFVVSEGLTNAARHSCARTATVAAELTPDGLRLEVGDDGTGGALARPGSGLEGLADRLAALDARLVVDSGPTGTRLSTVIPVRVMLADDAVLFREGLARILTEIGFQVTGRAGDGESLVELVLRDPPDVALLDLRMPPGFADEGIDAATAIRAAAPTVGLMLLSQYVEVHHALRLMTGFDGGVGYLLKDRVSDLHVFGADLRKVAAGGTVIDSELVTRLVARRRENDPLGALTDRERAVLALMARGHSNTAIAADLHLAVKTVEAHVTAIFSKLGLAPGDREHRRVLAVLRFLRA